MTGYAMWTLTLTLAILRTSQGFAGPPSFTGLGTIGGPSSEASAWDISADGSTVVGYYKTDIYSSDTEPFRWTSNTGLVLLGSLFPQGVTRRWVSDVSADGSKLVGHYFGSDGQAQAFRYSQTTGVVGQGVPNGPFRFIYVNGVSGDGMKMVGSAYRLGGWCDYWWGRSRSSKSIGVLQGSPGASWQKQNPLSGTDESTAMAISLDGSTIVGHSWRGLCASFEGLQACLWQGSGPVPLGFLEGGFWSEAYAVSGNGSVVVGRSNYSGDSNSHAFRWTSATGMIDLGDLAGGSASSAGLAVSEDGAIVIGTECSANCTPFIWDQANGMRDLQSVLVGLGLDLTGWTLSYAADISADGLTIVGNGSYNGQAEAWIAHLGDSFP